MSGRAQRVRSFLLAALLSTTWSAVTYADESDGPNIDDERTARADVQFQEGVKAFASGRYHAAIQLFTEADRIQPKPELSFDIGRSYENLGEAATAVAFYREYLRRAVHPPDEADVLQRIDGLESQRVSHPVSEDDGPQVLATRSPTGPYPGGGRADGGPPPDSEGNGSGKVLRTIGWAGLGAAAVAFGGAAIFEVMRNNAEDDAAREHQQIRFDQYVQTMESDRTAARVLFGTGAALAVTGGVFLVVGASQSNGHDKKSRVALRVSPESGGLSAGASWRF
jgi:tetratricopeptide (TPR) repeat protein